MAREDVNIKVSANVAEAIQMWKAMEEGPKGMANQLQSMGQKSKPAIQGLTGALDGMAGKWISVGAAIVAAREELDKYYRTAREHEERGAQTTAAADKAVRTYYTRQRISDPMEQQQALRNIGAQAMTRTSSLAAAGDAATTLAEFGFSREQAEGDALLELLTLQDSVAGAGGDSATVSRKVLEIIQRSGRPKSARSIRDLGIATNQLTGKAAGFNAEMMEEFAAMASAGTAGGVDESTGLAMWAALREGQEGKVAKKLFKEMMKPGDQRGEKEIRTRAALLLGGGEAEKDYQAAADIASSGISSRQDESETANVLGMMKGGAIPREEAFKRLQALLSYNEIPEAGLHGRIARENMWKHPGFTIPILGWSTEAMYSTEDLAERQAEMLAPGFPFSNEHERNMQSMKRQILGLDPLPFNKGRSGGGPIQIEVTTKFTDPQGMTIPNEPAATGLSR